MNVLEFPGVNLLAGWIGITLGIVTGLFLGLRFHEPDWLGGYNSFPRRMIRLAHISLFGLALINLVFYFTVQDFAAARTPVAASWGFLIGAVTMPLCCLAMAATVRARMFFAVPVVSLAVGGVLTLAALFGR